jgi:hypothetical protein
MLMHSAGEISIHELGKAVRTLEGERAWFFVSSDAI